MTVLPLYFPSEPVSYQSAHLSVKQHVMEPITYSIYGRPQGTLPYGKIPDRTPAEKHKKFSFSVLTKAELGLY